MKKYNIQKLSWLFAVLLLVTAISGCKKDEEEPKIPISSFQFEVSEENPLEFTFKSYSKYADTYSWDFGDNIGTSTEENPTYTYLDGGSYEVVLTVGNSVGTHKHTKEVTAINPEAKNYIENGEFDDESIWTIISHNGSENGVLEIANGVARWDEAIDVPSGSWGQEAHMGMYQVVEVEDGNYKIDLDITTNGIDELWFEVWVGPNEPVVGSDYNEGSGATRVLSFNAWDCAATNAVYSGPMSEASCHDLDGSMELAAGDYFVVIRSGGFTFGQGGIIADNVTMIKLD